MAWFCFAVPLAAPVSPAEMLPVPAGVVAAVVNTELDAGTGLVLVPAGLSPDRTERNVCDNPAPFRPDQISRPPAAAAAMAVPFTPLTPDPAANSPLLQVAYGLG
jgi:hypothetical protein